MVTFSLIETLSRLSPSSPKSGRIAGTTPALFVLHTPRRARIGTEEIEPRDDRRPRPNGARAESLSAQPGEELAFHLSSSPITAVATRGRVVRFAQKARYSTCESASCKGGMSVSPSVHCGGRVRVAGSALGFAPGFFLADALERLLGRGLLLVDELTGGFGALGPGLFAHYPFGGHSGAPESRL